MKSEKSIRSPDQVTGALKDQEIRSALKVHLNKRSPAPIRIIDELGIHNGNAVADVVAVYQEMHCFEIKGATDSIHRIVRQADFFNTSFPRITLVTTDNHFNWCSRNLPNFWGIIIAHGSSTNVRLKYVRPALHNPHFVKSKALLMLWKEELSAIATGVANIPTKTSYSRSDIAMRLSSALKKEDALTSIKNAILKRALLNRINDESDVGSES